MATYEAHRNIWIETSTNLILAKKAKFCLKWAKFAKDYKLEEIFA